MGTRFMKRGAIALTVLAAAVFAVGIGAKQADAQTSAVSAGGPYQAAAGQTVQFTGTSYVGSLAAASWTFSDGASLTGVTVYRAFSTPGTYTAAFNATDTFGRTYSAATTVTVYSAAASTLGYSTLGYSTLLASAYSTLPTTASLLALNPSLASLYAQLGIALPTLPTLSACTIVRGTFDWPSPVYQVTTCPTGTPVVVPVAIG